MNYPIARSIMRNKLKCICCWIVPILALLCAGCFESKTAARQSDRKAGVAIHSRVFAFHQAPLKERDRDDAVFPDPLPLMNESLLESPDLAQKAAELGIAMPAAIGYHQRRSEDERVMQIGGGATPGSRPFSHQRSSAAGNAAAMLFSGSFKQLLSSAFGSSKEVAQLSKDELPNPFVEAKQKQDSAAAPSLPAAASSSAKSDASARTDAASNNSGQSASTAQSTAPPPPSPPPPPALPSGGSGVVSTTRFVIVGDFNGDGALNAIPAERSDDATFTSLDGSRSFNLYIISAAAVLQNAFCIEDINGDGNPDLLIANHGAPRGGVYLGDGAGGYSLAGAFLTGYEPVVPVGGPMIDGERQILTANMRSGALTTFHSADGYKKLQVQTPPFLLNYALHMSVQDNSSSEYLLAANSGGQEQILKWDGSGLLGSTPATLGVNPTTLSVSFGSNFLQVFQVGNYASVVLNNQGYSFNVANFRIAPGIYLVIGDLQQTGYTDVAAAYLMRFAPKNAQ